MLFPEGTQYDEVAKGILDLGDGPPLVWLAGWRSGQPRFDRWHPTELTLPGLVQRICDAIALLTDEEHGGMPVAGLIEVETSPTPHLLDRLGIAGHLLRLTLKPNDLPGDRWGLIAIPVCLTGKPSHQLAMAHGNGVWLLEGQGCNFAEKDAATIVAQLGRQEIPEAVAAFVSLMQKGGEASTISEWLTATAHLEAHRRRELAAANVVFGELTGCGDNWLMAVKELNMVESKYLASIKAEGRNEGLKEGVLRLLARSGPIPSDLEAALRACPDQAQLLAWFDLASERPTVEEFRRQTSL